MDLSAAALVATSAAVFIAASIHATMGFGFALVAAPVLFATLGPEEAVGTIIALGMWGSALVLAAEGRKPEPLVRDSLVIILAAVPGALAGVAVLRSLDDVALQVAVTVGVVATLGIRHRASTAEALSPNRPAWSAPLAGFAAGALTTSTSTNGPPLLLHLVGREIPPASIRDTLNMCFLGMGAIGAVALVVTGTDAALPGVAVVAIGAPLVALGNLTGRQLFARLVRSGNYELILTIVLAVAVSASLVAVLA